MELLKKKLGVNPCDVLLPKNPEMIKCWPVIACDQYTSSREYWDRVKKRVENCDAPSSYNIILPEIFLETPGEYTVAERIQKINKTMFDYLEQGVLKNTGPGMILIDRKTPFSPSRKGLIFAIDLEVYDFAPDSGAAVRATEGTVMDRIPPRLEIRKDAPLEISHIMLLCDDINKTIIEPLFRNVHSSGYIENSDSHNYPGSGINPGSDFGKNSGSDCRSDSGNASGHYSENDSGNRSGNNPGNNSESGSGSDSGFFPVLYDVELPENGGHIKGWHIPENSPYIQDILLAMSRLPSYTEDGFLFAVGDGNHSLATAKTHWENIKRTLTDPDNPNHPARYALVELVNIHDPGLTFEPIHRVIFGAEPEDFLNFITENHSSEMGINIGEPVAVGNTRKICPEAYNNMLAFTVLFSHNSIQESVVVSVESSPSPFAAGTAQFFIDKFLHVNPGARVDYIHGYEDTLRLAREGVGILLPPLSKKDFFHTIATHGTLPRKTFSMGEADEKRFYMETRKIV